MGSNAFAHIVIGLVVASLVTGTYPGKSHADNPILPPLHTTPISIGSQAQTVAPGTVLPLIIDTPLDARTSQPGDPITARLGNDFLTQTSPQQPIRVVLPKGTTVRGRVTHVKQPHWFSRGGWLTLQFDHVVLPNGELLPITLALSASNQGAKKQPSKVAASKPKQPIATQPTDPIGLYQDPGIKAKLRADVGEGQAKAKAVTQAGIAKGEALGGKTGRVIATPIAALGGAAVGAGTFAKEGVKSLVLPGESVVIEPGTQLLVDFSGAFTIPVE